MKTKYTIKEKVEMAQFAPSSSIHAASKHYAVDRKRIREWIQYLKAGKFNGVSSTAARLPGGGRHVISEILGVRWLQSYGPGVAWPPVGLSSSNRTASPATELQDGLGYFW